LSDFSAPHQYSLILPGILFINLKSMFMSYNLIDSVKGLLSSDLIGKASSMLGESESNVQRAVNGIVPSVFAGVLNKAGSGDAQGILNLAKDAAGSGMLSNLGGLLSGGGLLSKGADMLKGLFGDKASGITSLISNFSGIKESSASSLLSVATPVALGVLGKQVIDSNMNAGGLLSFLNNQKDNILNAVPSGLNLAGALGLGSLSNISSKLSGALSGISGGAKEAGAKISHMAGETAEKAAGGMRWLLPLLLVVLAIGLLWYFKGCNSSENKTTVVTDTVTKTTDTAVAAVIAPVRESLKVKLPDGVELDAYKGGIEDQLVMFLNDPKSVAGKDVWFDFDDLNFKTNSADITDESMKQVQNITAILKAYPKLKIKIGGYTDKTGDSLANIKLSNSRAAAVVTALKTSGANASQLTGSEGYGSQFAKAAADAPDDERKKDRRISVSVRAK
jgi:outer membrane protein OmpA-like peptidoglycan-associated protein